MVDEDHIAKIGFIPRMTDDLIGMTAIRIPTTTSEAGFAHDLSRGDSLTVLGNGLSFERTIFEYPPLRTHIYMGKAIECWT